MEIPAYVLRVAQILNKNSYEAWVVGGSLRDLLIGKPVYDYDIATNAPPEKVMEIFQKAIPTGIKHGTVTVLMKNHHIEVTTYRMEGKYSDGRRPDRVTYAKTIFEDLSRRDFTINGVAFNPITGELIDPYDGREDIQKRLIRSIGNPIERFNEDGLRPLRACRFAAQLGFNIEEATFNAIPMCVETFSKVSQERIRDELSKIIKSEKPSVGIELLRASGLLNLIIPELLTGFGIKQNRYHRYDIYYHNLHTCDAADPKDYRIRLAALFHDIGKYYAKKEIEEGRGGKKSVFYNHEIIGAVIGKNIMRRLKFSNDDIRMVSHLIKYHMFHYTSQWTDGAVRRFVRKVGLENLEPLFELRRADRIGNGLKSGYSNSIKNLKARIDRVLEAENAITVRDLAVNGHDIMEEFGLKPGPIIGLILNTLLEEILDDPTKNRRETLLSLARDVAMKNRVEISK